MYKLIHVIITYLIIEDPQGRLVGGKEIVWYLRHNLCNQETKKLVLNNILTKIIGKFKIKIKKYQKVREMK